VKTRVQQRADFVWLPQPPDSGVYRHWLVDEGSLTRRLQSRCVKFEVRGVRQAWMRPFPDEAALLGLKTGECALIREVWLHEGDLPLVFARSILPRSSLRGAWGKLGQLGSRPLGAALFSDLRVRRRPLAYKKLGHGHPMLKEMHIQQPLWARRSVFERDCHAILVTEAFLPGVLTL